MGLSSGCTNDADIVFSVKYPVVFTVDYKIGAVRMQLPNNNSILLSKFFGDCTAATIDTTHSTTKTLIDALPIIREYLSLNARINCFGTRLIQGETETKEFIKALVKNNVLVSHVTKGNRNKRDNEYMVSYNICTASPIISGYISGYPRDVQNTTHNHFDVDKFKDLRKQFGLYIKQGKSL